MIGTTFDDLYQNSEFERVPENGTRVPFSEGLLRQILSLTPSQQKELVTRLINDKDFSKKKFGELAEAYKLRNEIYLLLPTFTTQPGLPVAYHCN